MEEEFKEQLKGQIEGINSEISKRMSTIKGLRIEIAKLKTEKANMNRLLIGKKQGRPKKKKEEEPESP